MQKQKTSTEYLSCELTEAEYIAYSAELAHHVVTLAELEEEKKAAMADFNDRKKSLQLVIDTTAVKLKDKAEKRAVGCIWEPNSARKTWDIYRTDTNEHVREEKMRSEDMQLQLDDAPVIRLER